MEKSIANNLGLGIIILFSIMPFFGFFSLKFLGRSPDQLILLLSLLSIGLYLFERGRLNFSPYLIVFSLFVFYTILSDIFLANKNLGFGYIRRNSFLGSLFMLIVIDSVQINKNYHNYINKISYYTIFIALLVIVIQSFINSTFFVPADYQRVLTESGEMESRFPSIYAWLGSLSEIGICFFPILGLFIEKKIKNNNKYYVLLYIIGMIVALLNKSRFVLLNFILLFILMPIHRGFNINTSLRYIVIFIVLGTGIYYGSKLTPFDLDKYINERLLEKQHGGLSHGSASSRIVAFEVFSKLFPQNAIWGKGKLHSFGEGSHASKDIKLVRTLSGRSSQIHIGYLSLFYYYGLVGGVLYIIFLIILTKKLVQDAKSTKSFAVLIGWIMFLVTNLTMVTLDIFHMGIAIILYYNHYNLSTKSAEISQ